MIQVDWNIYYTGQVYKQEIEKIFALFYDDFQVNVYPLEERGKVLPTGKDLIIEVDNEEFIEAKVMLLRKNEDSIRYSHRTSHDEKDPIEIRKRLKRTVSYSLLKVLEEYTGMEQPWGILTGIRPTKLYHSFLQEGRSPEEAAEVLRDERLVSAEKTELLQAIAHRQLQVLPDLYQLNDKEVSLYIGIPFCPTKCAYCTFPAFSIQGQKKWVEPFLSALQEEIRQIGKWLHEKEKGITSIYFGGGTPTSLEAGQMEQLFQTLYESMPAMDQVREFTVEAGRPDTITEEKLEMMKKWKVDRISINPQSFTQKTLDAIGRHHTVEETIEKYELARSYGFTNINMDLIIGLPGETRHELLHSLEQADLLRPESLTVHTLSFKRASEMTQNREKYPVAGREEIHWMMNKVQSWTQEKGYVPYYLYRQRNILGNLENVGYSLPKKENMYNIIIMEEKQTILGLGCGATSKIFPPGTHKMIRWPNPKEPRYYVDHFQEMIENKILKLNES